MCEHKTALSYYRINIQIKVLDEGSHTFTITFYLLSNLQFKQRTVKDVGNISLHLEFGDADGLRSYNTG